MIYAAAILLLLLMKKKPGTSVSTNSDFAKDLYDWVSKKAGGLANGTAGGDANLERADCDVVGSNGQVMVPAPHTSADVTYKTYKYLAPKLGIIPSCQDWAAMSNKVKSPSWFKFVDYYRKKGLSYSNHPVLSSYMGLWHWGGWVQEYMPTSNVLAVTQSALPDKIKLRRLVELRKQYFEVLADRRGYPDWLVEAWKNRAESFYTTFNKYV